MAIIAHFKITDYDGQFHEFYRFLDGYPCDSMGVLAAFPRGKHDFCLETFVRRLQLTKSVKKYWTDVSYEMDLKTKVVEVSSECYQDFNFKGSFEEAIRHYVDKGYSEKGALSEFPDPFDVSSLCGPNLIDWFWEIIHAITCGIQELDYDIYEQRKIIIGDNPIFYTFNDFETFSSWGVDNKYEAAVDAKLNARRIGLMTCFENKTSNGVFMFNYMITLSKKGYMLPMTKMLIPYCKEISEDVKCEELEMIVENIRRQDLKRIRALNLLRGLQSDSQLQEIRDSIRKRKE